LRLTLIVGRFIHDIIHGSAESVEGADSRAFLFGEKYGGEVEGFAVFSGDNFSML
jgi:hypothetical protein